MPASANFAVARTRGLVRRAGLALVVLGGLACSDASGPGGRLAIDELDPAGAPRGGDAFLLTVTGRGFVDGATVRWNGAARSAVVVDGTHLTTVVTPLDLAVAGAVPVAVVNPDGAASNALAFTVGPAAPTVSSVSPSSAQAGAAALELTVLGADFTPASVVRWNGAPRPTTFVAGGELRATIAAADLAVGGAVEVVVSSPDGGASRARTFTVNNPAPSLATLSPGYAAVGAGAVTLTLTGSGFVPSSVVRWNGVDRVAAYVSPTQITTTVPAADLSALGTALVAVRTPAPGGGTTSSLPFAVGISSVATLALRANDLVADAARARLYASVAGTDAARANTVAKIDPATGVIEATVVVGSDPGRMAMSDDGQYLYVALRGTGEVARVDLATFTAGPKFALGSGWAGTLYAEDLDVLPGRPTSVAVARKYANTSPGHGGVAVYDAGVPRAAVTPDNPINSVVEFTAGAATLYGANTKTTGNDFNVLAVGAGGLTVASTTPGLVDGFGTDMVAAGGRLYLSDGIVIDPAASTRVAAGRFGFDASAARVVRPDVANNRVHFLSTASPFGAAAGARLWAFDATTFAPAGSLTVPGVGGGTGRLARWGADGLAFPAADRLVLVRTSLVAAP